MKRLLCLIAPAALALAVLPAAPAQAQLASSMSAASQTLMVPKDKSVAFRLSFPVGRIVIAQPDIAELVATTDQSFYIRGKAQGVTNILAYDRQNRLVQVIDVRVGYDTESLQQDLALTMPGEHITAVNFAGGVLLSGKPSNMAAAQRALAIAERYAPKQVQSDMTVSAPGQIMVEVRVIEASRTALKELGFNINAAEGSGFNMATGTNGLASNIPPMGTFGYTGTIGSVHIDANLQALEQKGVVRTLARPNLVAMSGEEASFLAGGEFPYPVPAGTGLVSIEFKPFGVKLNVTPVIEDNGMIRLKVAPEVSALDPRQRLRIEGFDLPALTMRRAATIVELKDGQSFAIAGLMQQDYINSISQVPWAGDIPILGALFRSSSWKRQETELVIIVTPRLTAPEESLVRLPQPMVSEHEPAAEDLVLTGRAFDKPIQTPIKPDSKILAPEAHP